MGKSFSHQKIKQAEKNETMIQVHIFTYGVSLKLCPNESVEPTPLSFAIRLF